MAVHDCDRLTGGTFMLLCEAARRPTGKARDSLAGKSDGRNNRELLKTLIEVFAPGYPEPASSTFPQNVSDYRACKVAKGIYLPFDQHDLVDAFDRQMREEYVKPLGRMSEFIDRFIDVDYRGSQLAGSLIGLIATDHTIRDEQELFVNGSGLPARKSDLATVRSVELDALLLGAWHYVVTNVPDNTVGRTTFERWHEKPSIPNSKWLLHADVLSSLGQAIPVIRSTDTDDATNTMSDESEVIEAEFVTDEEESHTTSAFADDSEPSTSESETARVVVFQGGTNNTNIGHVETLNLGRWS